MNKEQFEVLCQKLSDQRRELDEYEKKHANVIARYQAMSELIAKTQEQVKVEARSFADPKAGKTPLFTSEWLSVSVTYRAPSVAYDVDAARAVLSKDVLCRVIRETVSVVPEEFEAAREAGLIAPHLVAIIRSTKESTAAVAIQ